MTTILETRDSQKNSNSALKRIWFALKPKRTSEKRSTEPVNNLPKSGMPISTDVVTNLSIRAGFTTGSW